MDYKSIDKAQRYGYFTGEARYKEAGGTRHWGIFWKPLWYLDNTGPDPLTYHHPDGRKMRPNNRFKTDFGSVPWIAQMLCPVVFSSYRWRKSYSFHDSGYMERGLWIAKDGVDEYTFTSMTRAAIDDLLSVWIKAEGGGNGSATPIWSGVKIGGWAAWGKADLSKETLDDY